MRYKIILIKCWVTPLVFLQIFMIYLLFDSVNNKYSRKDKIKEINHEKTKFNKLLETNFDTKYQKVQKENHKQTSNQIWEELNKNLFFKKSSTFYGFLRLSVTVKVPNRVANR